jgi:hypothetical protein
VGRGKLRECPCTRVVQHHPALCRVRVLLRCQAAEDRGGQQELRQSALVDG